MCSGTTRADERVDWRDWVAGFAMVFPCLFAEASAPLAVLSFGAVKRNRRNPGGSGSGQARSSEAGLRSCRGDKLLRSPHACFVESGMTGRPAARQRPWAERAPVQTAMKPKDGRARGQTSDAKVERRLCKTRASPADPPFLPQLSQPLQGQDITGGSPPPCSSCFRFRALSETTRAHAAPTGSLPIIIVEPAVSPGPEDSQKHVA